VSRAFSPTTSAQSVSNKLRVTGFTQVTRGRIQQIILLNADSSERRFTTPAERLPYGFSPDQLDSEGR